MLTDRQQKKQKQKKNRITVNSGKIDKLPCWKSFGKTDKETSSNSVA